MLCRLGFLALSFGMTSGLAAAEYASHPPMRPPAEPSALPLGEDPVRFVDAARGDDANDGSLAKPWRTIDHAQLRIAPGETLVLRGGMYDEHVDWLVSGTDEKPITVRSHPGELAVIDGGRPVFRDDPATAWEPFEGGAPGEYISTRTYAEYRRRPILNAFPHAGWEPFHGKEDQRPKVMGFFGDSMIPLHGYRSLADLRDSSMLWDVAGKTDTDSSVYCGPGLWFDPASARIHVRLAHTNLDGLGDRNYSGETDPRKLPLVISGPLGEDVLRLNGVGHVVFRDLVFRGASCSPLVQLQGTEHVTFDGCTFHGGYPGMLIKTSTNLRIVNSAFRGNAAPWSSRASMKYRGVPSYQIITQRNAPQNADFEFAYNEFTDDHDFAWVRYVKNLRFHHNFVDRFNDDGFEVGARKRDHELYAYENLFSRCGITFTLHEMTKDDDPKATDPCSGVYLTRNVVDLRRGVFKAPPRQPDPSGAFLDSNCSLCGDHGGPIWPHYFLYQNTVVRPNNAWRGYYGFGMGARGTNGTTRRVFNNVFVQLEGTPGLNFLTMPDDGFVDGNLHWGLVDGPTFDGDYFASTRKYGAFSKQPVPHAAQNYDEQAERTGDSWDG